ncbi:MAG: BrnA antitoxin family protein [Proteobacteria bacterium]|nr:BrnA antitoxin family protein [Pseudomonadota bacterium]
MEKNTNKELNALSKMSDDAIDTSDIPEVINWDAGVRGRFFRPIKKRVTIRIDADVLEWFRDQNDQYQTAINKALRHYMNDHKGQSVSHS